MRATNFSTRLFDSRSTKIKQQIFGGNFFTQHIIHTTRYHLLVLCRFFLYFDYLVLCEPAAADTLTTVSSIRNVLVFNHLSLFKKIILLSISVAFYCTRCRFVAICFLSDLHTHTRAMPFYVLLASNGNVLLNSMNDKIKELNFWPSSYTLRDA